jgi:glycosyltransferase involved in cell wall biosynthesis
MLFLLPTYTFGGAERTSLNLLNQINTDRFRITLITSRNLFPYFQHIDLEDLLPVEDIGIDVWFTKPKKFIQDIRKIGSLLRQANPELSFGMMHYPSSLLVFAKHVFRLNMKTVVSPRGPSVEYLRYFEQSIFRKKYLNYIFRFFCSRADGVIVASNGMLEECIAYYDVNPSCVRVIPNCVDVTDAKLSGSTDTELDIPEGYTVITTAGRLEREKNLSFLIPAFARVRDAGKFKLVIVGDGTEKSSLQESVIKQGMEDDVIFTGYQKNPHAIIRQSDLFVHSCLFEGFANAIIEAMACRVPVVAVNCPYGPQDIITHGKNGFLVAMDDQTGLVDTILKLQSDSALRETIARNGYQRALDFSCESMTRSYEAFFEETMNKHDVR